MNLTGKLHSLQFSTDDGKTWHDLTEYVVGPIYFTYEGSAELVEITPDNPLYAELLEVLEKME